MPPKPKKIRIFASWTARLLARIFNVAPHEAGRIALAWGFKFCFFAGATVGTTMLTALLVTRAGIAYLPLLFVSSAALTILGTAIFAAIIPRFSRRNLILSLLAAGLTLLLTATFGLSDAANLPLFFGLALVAEGVFLAQLNILLGLLIEELFTPLESARAFPLIESSEYVGGIAGGLGILLALKVFHVAPADLAILWSLFLGGLLPLLAWHAHKQKELPSLALTRPVTTHLTPLARLREGASHIRSTPFLRGLMVVVALQWTLFTLLNFQYTEALDTSLGHGQAAESHGHEALLTHGLSTLHIAFSLLALCTQLFVTSRVLTRLGVVRTLAAHPLTASLTSLGLIFQFGLPSAVVARGLFEATTGVFNAAYHSSFYALRESVRGHAKEFLEGLVRPLGIILATGLLAALQHFLPASQLTPAVSVALLAGTLTLFGLLLFLRNHYTHVSKKNLELFGDHPAKYTSLDVLAQRGHADAAEILIKNLRYKKESERLRLKILETLGRLRDTTTIPEILNCFADPAPAIKLAAVRALGQFQNLGEHFFTQAFTRYRVISALKELFATENDKELRSAIVRVFANMHQAEVVPFLLTTLQTTDPAVRADCVYVCGLFHDVAAAHYLEPELNSPDPRVKASAIIALWQFPQYRLRLTILLTPLLEARERETEKAVLHLLGEIGALQEKPRLERYLAHPDPELQLLAALALAKLRHPTAAEKIVPFLLSEQPKLATLAHAAVHHLPAEMQKELHQLVHHRVSAAVTRLLQASHAHTLAELSPAQLAELKRLYAAAADFQEVAKIDAALAGKSFD